MVSETLLSQEDESPFSTKTDDAEVTLSKRDVIRNLLVIATSFVFLFTAFNSLAVLQSTLNKDGGLGTSSLAIIHGARILSCMFLPSVLVSRLGCKWTIALSMVSEMLYMPANMHAVDYLIYPTSIILGLAAAPQWSATCTYITIIASRYAEISGNITKHAAISRFLGFFFMLLQTSGIWGNLISSSLLKTQPKNISDEQLRTCGASFCPVAQSNNTNLEKPDDTKIYAMVGSYVACAVIAFLVVVLFLENIPEPKSVKDDATNACKRKLSLHLLVETFRHCWRSTPQKLLIPLTVYSGVEQAFLAGDFTKSYIGCSAGLWNVGYVMICYAVLDSICSLTFGRLVQYLGHVIFFVFGAVVHMSLLISLRFWSPTPDTFYALFIIAGLWGMADAVWQTQINALYGQLFVGYTEAAFANLRLWESVGFSITFAYSNSLCTSVKIYVCMALLVTGMVGYGGVEYHQKLSGKTREINEVI